MKNLKLFSPTAPPTLQKHVRTSSARLGCVGSGAQNIPRAEVIHLSYTAPTIPAMVRTVRLPVRTRGAPLRLSVHIANKNVLSIEELQPWGVWVIVRACNNARSAPACARARIIFGAANVAFVRAGLAFHPLLIPFS